jgi:hypothetical protein
MDAEVQPRLSLESQRDEMSTTAEDETTRTLRLKAPHEDQVLEAAEEELALEVEYIDAQLRTLLFRRSQRAGSLNISTFREYTDSFESEEELLPENLWIGRETPAITLFSAKRSSKNPAKDFCWWNLDVRP